MLKQFLILKTFFHPSRCFESANFANKISAISRKPPYEEALGLYKSRLCLLFELFLFGVLKIFSLATEILDTFSKLFRVLALDHSCGRLFTRQQRSCTSSLANPKKKFDPSRLSGDSFRQNVFRRRELNVRDASELQDVTRRPIRVFQSGLLGARLDCLIPGKLRCSGLCRTAVQLADCGLSFGLT